MFTAINFSRSRSLWLGLLLVIVVACGSLSAVSAQDLSPEMRETFNEMLPNLDSDLQDKVHEALRLNRDYLELTPDQFKRFRDDPANPFEGWDGIDPDSIEGIIRLRFETQPIRSRVPCEYERQSMDLLEQAKQIVHNANASTVVITDGKAQIALGTVVTPDGHVITKLSEIDQAKILVCKAAGERKWSAEIVGKNEANDIAILKIPAGQLPAAVFANAQPEIGGFIFSTDGNPAPMAFGVYSNPPRSLIGENQAFLGVKPVDDASGIKVVEVTPGSSADDIGLQLGDILTAVNGVDLTNVQSLVNEIRKNEPGDKIVVDYIRDGKPFSALAVLAGRNVGGPTADRFNQMQTFGAIQSKRRSEFPLVFQHDTPLVPEQCGGPVTDLDGKVVGINIARGGRVASYAIPAQHVQTLVKEMLRPSVAAKEKDLD